MKSIFLFEVFFPVSGRHTNPENKMALNVKALFSIAGAFKLFELVRLLFFFMITIKELVARDLRWKIGRSVFPQEVSLTVQKF
jgi:hypothetical protein